MNMLIKSATIKSALVITVAFFIEITEVEKKNYDHTKYITTREFIKVTVEKFLLQE